MPPPTNSITATDVTMPLPKTGTGAEPEEPANYGTYLGVFRPTLLTLFGVIMYARMGWVVGHAGLLGALAILAMTFTITGTAALSFSSISTNMRLRAGGVFSMVSQSLGLEAGGAIGVPLYLAQSLGAALYVYGFAEGWGFIFPTHPTWAVVLTMFLLAWGLGLVSERLALRLQFVVLVGVVLALSSMIGGFWTNELHTPQLIGNFEAGSLWLLFAVFFPAGTGIKVGASLSGRLRDPRRSIPIGILSAWGIALVTYVVLIVWYSMVASPEELRGNYLIATDRAVWGPAVLIGLLSSCASATLSSLVAAPNVLAALAAHNVLPFKVLARTDRRGSPRNAAVANGLIVGLALLLGDLNAVARLITMLFLITYATINLVVLIEKSLGLVSFRPTFNIPIWVPGVGAIAAVSAMIIVEPIFGMLALAFVVGIYFYLERQQLRTPWETVRSGMFIAVADWAARRAQRLANAGERAWKPDLLVPLDRIEQLAGDYRLLLALTQPKGSLHVLCLEGGEEDRDIRLHDVVRDLQHENLFTTGSVVRADSVVELTRMGTHVLAGSFFKPNVLFVNSEHLTDATLNGLLATARSAQMGVALLVPHPRAKLGRERAVNVWIRDQSPDWTLGLRLANLDLSLLLGYQLCRNWRGQLSFLTVAKSEETAIEAREFLDRLRRDARLPNTTIWVEPGDFSERVQHAPSADLNIMGLGEDVSIDALRTMTEWTRASCLFVLDSGHESALA